LKKTLKTPKRPEKAEPLRWDQIPHEQLWLQIEVALQLGSPARAAEDSLRSVLMRRLPRRHPADHLKYVELECSRIVETLRVVRDAYRAYLQPKVKGPLAEMYWVVTRFAVKDRAIVRLREAATKYIHESHIAEGQWRALFGFTASHRSFYFDEISEKQEKDASVRILSHGVIENAVQRLLPDDALDEILLGGPFGRDSQIRHAQSAPAGPLLYHGTLSDVIQLRQAEWDAALPWPEGLSRLFDAVQEEVMYQLNSLGTDGHIAEGIYLNLPKFHRIAHKHLTAVDRFDVPTPQALDEVWIPLLEELDTSGISPDQALEGVPRDVLMSLRRQQKDARTWAECYASSAAVMLEDNKPRTLRREMMHALHNAAKKAEYQLGKIWSSNAVASRSRVKVQNK
jgi:hypothetical protein